MKEYNVGKLAPYSLCLILLVMYFVDLPLNMWTFHFIHANIFHLCGNMIVIFSIFKGVDYRYLPVAFLLSSLEWNLIDMNVVGFSAIIFFMWGTRIISDFKQIMMMKGSAKRGIYVYMGSISLTFIISAIIPNVSFSLHFFPFVGGFIISAMSIVWRKFKDDTV